MGCDSSKPTDAAPSKAAHNTANTKKPRRDDCAFPVGWCGIDSLEVSNPLREPQTTAQAGAQDMSAFGSLALTEDALRFARSLAQSQNTEATFADKQTKLESNVRAWLDAVLVFDPPALDDAYTNGDSRTATADVSSCLTSD